MTMSDVRGAAIASIRDLALEHPSFAQSALNFLVDMFNDDAEQVGASST